MTDKIKMTKEGSKRVMQESKQGKNTIETPREYLANVTTKINNSVCSEFAIAIFLYL